MTDDGRPHYMHKITPEWLAARFSRDQLVDYFRARLADYTVLIGEICVPAEIVGIAIGLYDDGDAPPELMHA